MGAGDCYELDMKMGLIFQRGLSLADGDILNGSRNFKRWCLAEGIDQWGVSPETVLCLRAFLCLLVSVSSLT